MKNYIITAFAISALLLSGFQSKAQILPNLGGQRAGLSTLSFLKNDMNPRSFAMGGASVSISSDEFAPYSNPAGIADAESFSLATSNYFIGAGINQAYVSGIFPFKNLSGIAISLNSMNSGAMDVRTEFQPTGTGQKIYANNLAAGISYAKRLSDMFSIGITLKYIYEQMAEYNNSAASVDLGFTYTTDVKDLTFAVMVQNFSGNSSLEGDYLAVDYNRGDVVDVESYTVPTVFRLGASMIPWKVEDKHQLMVSFELQHPNDNAENFRFGAEYAYLKLLFIRAGYRINVEGKPFPSMGLGVRHRVGGHPLYLNYSVLPTQVLGTQHLVGLGFSINKDLQR